MRSASAMTTLTLPLESSDSWLIMSLPPSEVPARIGEMVLGLQVLLVLSVTFKFISIMTSKSGHSPIRPKRIRPHGLRVSYCHRAGRLSRRGVTSPLHAQCIMYYLMCEYVI